MKQTSGFDKRNSGFYRWVIFGIALASVLMLAVALLGKSAEGSPGRLHALVWPSVACAVAIWAYISTRRSKLSFPYVGITGVVFSLALYGFGMPLKLVFLVGLTSLLGAIVSTVLGEAADKQVEDDDLGA